MLARHRGGIWLQYARQSVCAPACQSWLCLLQRSSLLLLLLLLLLRCESQVVVFTDYTSNSVVVLPSANSSSTAVPVVVASTYSHQSGSGFDFGLSASGDVWSSFTVYPPFFTSVTALDSPCSSQASGLVTFNASTPSHCNYSFNWVFGVTGNVVVAYRTAGGAAVDIHVLLSNPQAPPHSLPVFFDLRSGFNASLQSGNGSAVAGYYNSSASGFMAMSLLWSFNAFTAFSFSVPAGLSIAPFPYIPDQPCKLNLTNGSSLVLSVYASQCVFWALWSSPINAALTVTVTGPQPGLAVMQTLSLSEVFNSSAYPPPAAVTPVQPSSSSSSSSGAVAAVIVILLLVALILLGYAYRRRTAVKAAVASGIAMTSTALHSARGGGGYGGLHSEQQLRSAQQVSAEEEEQQVSWSARQQQAEEGELEDEDEAVDEIALDDDDAGFDSGGREASARHSRGSGI